MRAPCFSRGFLSHGIVKFKQIRGEPELFFALVDPFPPPSWGAGVGGSPDPRANRLIANATGAGHPHTPPLRGPCRTCVSIRQVSARCWTPAGFHSRPTSPFLLVFRWIERAPPRSPRPLLSSSPPEVTSLLACISLMFWSLFFFQSVRVVPDSPPRRRGL